MAIQLNGTTQYLMDTGHSPVSQLPMTIAGWFNASSYFTSPATRHLVQVRNANFSNARALHGMYFAENDGDNYFYQVSQKDGGSVRLNGSFGYYTTNTWRHFAGVFTADSNLLIYVNGVLKATSPAATHNDGLFATLIGANYNTTSMAESFFAGSVAEVAFFPSALSAEKVLELYSGGAAGAGKKATSIGVAPASYFRLGSDILDSVGPVTLTAYGWYASPTFGAGPAIDESNPAAGSGWTGISGFSGFGSPAI